MIHKIWRFARPHTIIGSSVSVFTLLVLVVFYTPLPNTDCLIHNEYLYLLSDSSIPKSDANMPMVVGFIPLVVEKLSVFFTLFFPSLIACLSCNLFITGLNQISDIELDKINKPNLPLASSELSLKQAWTICLVALCLALAISWSIQPFFGYLIATIALIGTLYSMPPIRFKRYHVWAASAIALVRGPMVNIGLTVHFYTLVYNCSFISPDWLFPLTLFVSAFSLGIAWFKDIPDTEGDAEFGIRTVAVIWNKTQAFRAGVTVVSLAYVLIAWHYLMPNMGSRFFIAIGEAQPIIQQNRVAGIAHLLALLLFLWQSRRCDLNNPKSIHRFYMFYWCLFFLEYLMFPIIL